MFGMSGEQTLIALCVAVVAPCIAAVLITIIRASR
jgi:hypothetical protein